MSRFKPLQHCYQAEKAKTSFKLRSKGIRSYINASLYTQTSQPRLIPMSPLPQQQFQPRPPERAQGAPRGVRDQGSGQLLGLDNSQSATWTKSVEGSGDCP